MNVSISLMWHIVSHLLVSIPLLAENSASVIRENVISGERPKISEDRNCPLGLVELITVAGVKVLMPGQTSCVRLLTFIVMIM